MLTQQIICCVSERNIFVLFLLSKGRLPPKVKTTSAFEDWLEHIYWPKELQNLPAAYSD